MFRVVVYDLSVCRYLSVGMITMKIDHFFINVIHPYINFIYLFVRFLIVCLYSRVRIFHGKQPQSVVILSMEKLFLKNGNCIHSSTSCILVLCIRYSDQLALEDAVHTAILTLKESFEGQMTEDNIEIGICDKDGFRRLTPAEVKDYLAQIA